MTPLDVNPTQTRRLSPETILAQLDHYLDPQTGGVIPPIQPATTFVRDAQYELTNPGRIYARDGDPTVEPVERVIALIEGGHQSRLFSSGMAAIAALFRSLRPGERAVVQRSMYYGTVRWLERWAATSGVDLVWFDPADGQGALDRLLDGPAALVWIETPSNPMLHVTDIRAAAASAHRAGAMLCVDSTVAPPLITRPLELGADLVFHSATKIMNGHSDVLAGVMTVREPGERWQTVCEERAYAGAVISPFGAWLLGRGLRSLAVRLARACATASRIAQYLQNHPKVRAVHYPGLPSHPGYDIAAGQMTGAFGYLLSFEVGGDPEAEQSEAIKEVALDLVRRLELFLPATSLGGPETLIEHRYTVEGAAYGAPPGLLRVSAGLEAADDLLADLEQGLAAI